MPHNEMLAFPFHLFCFSFVSSLAPRQANGRHDDSVTLCKEMTTLQQYSNHSTTESSSTKPIMGSVKPAILLSFSLPSIPDDDKPPTHDLIKITNASKNQNTDASTLYLQPVYECFPKSFPVRFKYSMVLLSLYDLLPKKRKY
mmetsp:Transcript_29162/g.61924  ORF Transcript_29162/g.61924 Transcript_29162/m.61924 type:complete len:143 (+) Transcript_29162:62-490(+)